MAPGIRVADGEREYAVNGIAGFGVALPLPGSELLWAMEVFYSYELAEDIDPDAWPSRQLLVTVGVGIPQG